MHYKQEITDDEIPMEFVKLARAHLDASDQLNSLMCNGAWLSDCYRGQAVLWLAFHAIELFLKGFILKLEPTAHVKCHSLEALASKLAELDASIEFELPFGVQAASPDPDLVQRAQRREKQVHEMLRYPIDTQNRPWPGVHSFSSHLFQETLARTRTNCESLYARLFEDNYG